MSVINYPLDTTGLAVTNLVSSEQQILTQANYDTQRMLIPEFAPFYLNNLVLEAVDGLGAVRTLIEDVDYIICLPFVGASRSTGKMLYGGLSINDPDLNGEIRITYQTLGGTWTCDAAYVLAYLAEKAYNPRTTMWDTVTNVQEVFPPTDHGHHVQDITSYQDLITSINSLATNIGTTPSPTTPTIKHILAEDNPHHVTKDQVGLGLVANYPVATDADIAQPNTTAGEVYITLSQLTNILSNYQLK